jgi:hypothetical protein
MFLADCVETLLKDSTQSANDHLLKNIFFGEIFAKSASEKVDVNRSFKMSIRLSISNKLPSRDANWMKMG